MDVHIRWMIRRDHPEVLSIMGRSFARPWDEATLQATLCRRNHIGMTAERGGRVVGAMVYELRKADVLVCMFAVDPAFRRQGVGSAMAWKLVGKLDPPRRRSLLAVVRETNLGGQLFLRAKGWSAYRVERGAISDTGEDAFLFRLDAFSADPVRMALRPTFGERKRF